MQMKIVLNRNASIVTKSWKVVNHENENRSHLYENGLSDKLAERSYAATDGERDSASLRSTIVQSMFEKNASIYLERSAGL